MSFGYQILGCGSGGGAAPVDVDYLVVAGGGAGTYGGGGAGGYRTSFPGGTKLTLNAGEAIPITVGGGGVVATPTTTARPGADSVLATTASPISSSGGGGSCPAVSVPSGCPAIQGQPGGSGGGSRAGIGGLARGIGNKGGYTPPEGNDGGDCKGISANFNAAGGGGGATEAGVCGEGPPQVTGRGGAGAPNTISGSDVAYAGGAGGMCGGKSPCGSGGGYAPSPAGGPDLSGSTNTGGGGTGGNPSVGSGGSGIVIIRYLYQ